MGVFLGDIVFEGGLVAFDGDVEELFDGLAVVIECAARQRTPVGVARAHPTGVNFVARHAAMAFERVDEPHIAVEEVACHGLPGD